MELNAFEVLNTHSVNTSCDDFSRHVIINGPAKCSLITCKSRMRTQSPSRVEDDAARGHTTGKGQPWMRDWLLSECEAHSHSPLRGRKWPSVKTSGGQMHEQDPRTTSTEV